MENSLVNPSQRAEDSRPLRSSAEGKAARLGHYPFLLRAVGLGIPLILLCAPTVGDLVNLWWTRYGFLHGFLVPLVSLYLAWLQKPALQHIPVAPALGPGLLWLVVATLLLLASQAGGVITTASVALILVFAGLILLLCGCGYLKALSFPLAYLIFMTPVLDLLTEPLAWPFQLLTASMSVSMLQALGIPVLLENSLYIILPTVTLRVDRGCSGAGVLIAVLAIGLPLAYLTLQAWWSRITLVVSSVMIAIVANWIRVTVMGILAQSGSKNLHGPYHILHGLFVDWVAFAFLFVGAWFLGRLEQPAPIPALPREQGSFSGFIFHGAAWNRAWWLGIITLAAAAIFLYSLDRGATAVKKDLATFPDVVGEWVIDHTLEEDSFIGLQDVDESLVRTYRAPDGRRIHLYVGYTKTQRQGKELVGMETAPLHGRAIATDLRIGAVSLPWNRTFIDKSHRQIHAVFWYHIDGMSYADRSQAKLATIKQAFLRGRTDGALVLVSAELRTGQSEEQWKAQEEFAGVVFPLMQEYLP
jgi:EpsI family protein